ncbi:MAG: TonB-dependent receptor plug domain-containing protein [Prevotellaceae bacterium]|jgi:hypothetical protein|nr:TonB-dependent receptor plug domain-containing protein [Prevotellaceae bacterium]
MRKIFLTVLFLSSLHHLLLGQREGAFSYRIEENLLNQLTVYPQEKIYLHTDRDIYIPGEKIWFKAYLTDAATHRYPTGSRYVYVELIDMHDLLVERVMIRPTDGLFHGSLFLSEQIPEGNYTLRSYTRYMENLGDDYFFKKNIRIRELSSGKEQVSIAKQENEEKKLERDDFEVSFFPEGGNLPEGVLCKVAFKALNKKGYPEIIFGEVVDETGTEIGTVTTFHAGMGVFYYVPEQGKSYYLNCRSGNGVEKQFALPLSDPWSCSLAVTRSDQKIQIRVQKAIHCPAIQRYLLVHCRGLILYFSAWDDEKVPVFAEKQLPGGVIQFILFDEQMNPLSERIVFIKNDNEAKVKLHTNKAIYEPRENVLATLSLSDLDENPLTGHLSVAITDDKELPVGFSTTIEASLLLSSELKGYIENPAWYLLDNTESSTGLDYLMMTHGWRRYNIPEVVKGNLEYPKIPYQVSQKLSGEVKSLVRSRPVTDSPVSVVVIPGIFGTTTTDEKGRFMFLDFEHPDRTDYFIEALSKTGNKQVKLEIDRESFPNLVHAPQSRGTKIGPIKDEATDELFLAKAKERSEYNKDMRITLLNEATVTASKVEKRDEPRLLFPLNEGSDVTIRREEFEKRVPRSIIDELTRVPGVLYDPDTGLIFIRGNRGSPLFLLDGVRTEWDIILNNLSVYHIESIDIFKGPSAVIFGAQGAYGAISITTRMGTSSEGSGERKSFHYATYTPLGYQKPVEFYAPRYDTQAAKQSNIPDYRTTLFWKPDIVVSESGEANFDFYTADSSNTYSVVLEGITTDGRIIRQVERISIRALP